MITAFSWMLIHSLWQGLLLAVIAGTVLMLTKKSAASHRYNIILILFISFIGLCAYTFIAEWNMASKKPSSAITSGNTGVNIPALFSTNAYDIKQFGNTFSDYFSANAPMIVLIWFVAFLFKSVKIIACLVYNNRVKNVQVFEPDRFWADAIKSFTEKLNIKKTVKLVQSGYIKMPVVIGHLKPVILIPAGLLTGLPAEQVEAILLHELAHIRRNDYFVNFLQNITETIFFFNPGLLWISSLLREERENCCDDIALEQTQNKVGFVQALISFKEHELYGSKYATAFPGKKNYLFRRITRILNNKSMTFGSGEKIFLMVSVILLAFVLGTAALGQVKGQLKGDSTEAQNKTANDSIPTDSISASKDAARVVYSLERKRISHNLKMRDGIAGIKEKSEPVEIDNAVISSLQTTTAENNQGELSEEDQVRDKIQAKKEKKEPVEAGSIRIAAVRAVAPKNNQRELSEKDQEIRDREQARRDKEQVQRDQAQAIKDQQQAIKDQAQAKIDQAAALKDQAQAHHDQQVNENKEQVARNKEQARLNQIQARRNEEQDARNQKQERLNEIQAIKNQEQAKRNEAQARLNQIQAEKNNEQAMKDKSSIQE